MQFLQAKTRIDNIMKTCQTLPGVARFEYKLEQRIQPPEDEETGVIHYRVIPQTARDNRNPHSQDQAIKTVADLLHAACATCREMNQNFSIGIRPQVSDKGTYIDIFPSVDGETDSKDRMITETDLNVLLTTTGKKLGAGDAHLAVGSLTDHYKASGGRSYGGWHKTKSALQSENPIVASVTEGEQANQSSREADSDYDSRPFSEVAEFVLRRQPDRGHESNR